LAIDSSSQSQKVIEEVLAPWPFGSSFCVLSVVEMARWEALPTLIEDAKHEAQNLVSIAQVNLSQAGHETFSEVESGFPKTILL
jgi:hypothetical protein